MRFAFAVALAVLVASPAFADTTATIKITSSAGDKGGVAMDGRWYLKGKRVRSELSGMFASVTLIDSETKRVYALHEATKTYSEIDLAQSRDGMDVATCAEGDVEGCLKKQGFRKTGTAEANGLPCEVWERTQDAGQRAKLFRTTKRKSMQIVRITFESAEGGGQMDVIDVKDGPLDDALFTIPAGWTKRGIAPAAMPGAKAGKMPSREEIEKLMKQYGVQGQPPQSAPQQ